MELTTQKKHGPESFVWKQLIFKPFSAGSIFLLIEAYPKSIQYAEPPLCYSGNPDHRLVIGSVCIQCHWLDPYPDRPGSDRLITRYHTKSLDPNIFLIYTVHSISKATVSTVAIFLAPCPPVGELRWEILLLTRTVVLAGFYSAGFSSLTPCIAGLGFVQIFGVCRHFWSRVLRINLCLAAQKHKARSLANIF